MTRFEWKYTAVRPFMVPLWTQAWMRIRDLSHSGSTPPEILDVGGRKSHYTIGIRGAVTITDLPRETAVQHEKKLGINADIIRQTQARRSNIKQILYDDMTCSKLPANAYDLVTAIEVMEHVEHDTAFVRNVYRVLKPGGRFLMTTPNGEHFDIRQVNNPDNKRFYTRESLGALLATQFKEFDVEFAVPLTVFRKYGRKYGKQGWSLLNPLQTGLSMGCNLIGYILGRRSSVKNDAKGTAHLLAVASKK